MGWFARAARNRHVRAGLKDEASEASGAESNVPCCEEFSVQTGYEFPRGFSVSEFRGLLSCQVIIVDAKASKVIVYWTQRGFSEANGARLRARLKVPDPFQSGAVVDIKHRGERFWRRHSLAAVVIGLAALFAALSALRGYYSVLFASPSVAVSYSGGGPIDVVEGTSFSVSLNVRSQVRFAPMIITFDLASLTPRIASSTEAPHLDSLRLDRRVLPSLQPGESGQVTIEGLAPRYQGSDGTPALYKLTVRGEAAAGLLRQTIGIPQPVRIVRVWSEAIQAAPLRELKTAGPVCTLDGAIFPPRSYQSGRVVSIVYARAPGDVTQAYLATNINSAPFQDNGTGVQRVLKATFTTPRLSQFKPYPYTVLLYFSTNISSQICRKQAGEMKVYIQQ